MHLIVKRQWIFTKFRLLSIGAKATTSADRLVGCRPSTSCRLRIDPPSEKWFQTGVRQQNRVAKYRHSDCRVAQRELRKYLVQEGTSYPW